MNIVCTKCQMSQSEFSKSKHSINMVFLTDNVKQISSKNSRYPTERTG